jgi:hypothetical protein
MNRRRERDEGRQERPPDVRAEHHPAPVQPIGERPGEEPEQQVRDGLKDSDHTHRQAGARQGEDEEWQGGEGDGIADRGQPLPADKDLEIPVLREGQVEFEALPAGLRTGRALGAGRAEGRLEEDLVLGGFDHRGIIPAS